MTNAWTKNVCRNSNESMWPPKQLELRIPDRNNAVILPSQLSPKKTKEGFYGGALLTLILGFFYARHLATYQYLTCPVEVRPLDDFIDHVISLVRGPAAEISPAALARVSPFRVTEGNACAACAIFEPSIALEVRSLPFSMAWTNICTCKRGCYFLLELHDLQWG